MKRIIKFTCIIVLMVIVITGCTKNEKVVKDKGHTTSTKITDYLYEISYTDYKGAFKKIPRLFPKLYA